ncbi:MAG TPA: response regulator transcription factor [Vicinamibacterales bacterium]|nr:response regulator transcription factor [Vicinamibacterales bacterium]
MRILIAEDDATSLRMLSAILTKAHYGTITVDNGVDALRVLQRSEASLAILDLVMPGMDGLEVVRRIRRVPPPIPPYIIMLSSRNEKPDVIAGLNAGANDYVGKPFDADELSARVAVGKRMVEMRVTLSNNLQELADALDQVRTLRGILPICAKCKNIRDDQGYWSNVETYLKAHTKAEFSHAVCPDCMDKLYPQFSPNRKDAAEN